MKFNEDSRVKIPALVHFTRLGYRYLPLTGATWDLSCNIFPTVFKDSLQRINPSATPDDIARTLQEVSQLLDNEDLGKAFHERLVSTTGVKLVDFEDFTTNSFSVVTELPCLNGDEEFRPDITLLINGLPLAFIEVKKPNNREGILAEHSRIATRSQNPKFRRFINITQLMMFSNNMEYDDSSPEPLEGAFYATSSYGKPSFNFFREENPSALPVLPPVDPEVETLILADNNLHALKHAAEYATNSRPDSPTNRLSTSLFCPQRLAFLLRYGIAYVRGLQGFEKHVMRYPQIFATHAIETKISSGKRKGIIWHTQGSGKTALAFYNVKHLTDYYQRKGVIPKFYFIVDRIDLLIQAAGEFRSRGLVVHEVDSRSEFARDIKSTQAPSITTPVSWRSPSLTFRNSPRTPTSSAPPITTSSFSASTSSTRSTAATTPRAVSSPTSTSPTLKRSKSASPALPSWATTITPSSSSAAISTSITTTPRSKTATPSASFARPSPPSIGTSSPRRWRRSRSSRAVATASLSTLTKSSSSPCSITSSATLRRLACCTTIPAWAPW